MRFAMILATEASLSIVRNVPRVDHGKIRKFSSGA